MAFETWLSLILVRNVVGELQPKRTLAASRGFLAAARLSCSRGVCLVLSIFICGPLLLCILFGPKRGPDKQEAKLSPG